MIILRVVNGNGDGMYSFCPKLCSSLWNEATNGADDDILHPLPDGKMLVEIDKIRIIDGCIPRFGFRNKRQFLRWVYDPDWRTKMAELGGVLRVYEVPSDFVVQSNEQAVFSEEHATLLEELPVDIFDRNDIKSEYVL